MDSILKDLRFGLRQLRVNPTFLKPYDPVTLGGAAALLAAVALCASYGPAHRASRLEPMDALRKE